MNYNNVEIWKIYFRCYNTCVSLLESYWNAY